MKSFNTRPRKRVHWTVAAALVGSVLAHNALGQEGSSPIGTRDWLDAAKSADERANLLAARLSQSEKIALTQGEDFGATAGKLADLTRYGLPTLLEADAPQGITNLSRKDAGTVMPAAIATAATWNIALAQSRAEVLADEDIR